jgi:hypothetical protein
VTVHSTLNQTTTCFIWLFIFLWFLPRLALALFIHLSGLPPLSPSLNLSHLKLLLGNLLLSCLSFRTTPLNHPERGRVYTLLQYHHPTTTSSSPSHREWPKATVLNRPIRFGELVLLHSQSFPFELRSLEVPVLVSRSDFGCLHFHHWLAQWLFPRLLLFGTPSSSLLCQLFYLLSPCSTSNPQLTLINQPASAFSVRHHGHEASEELA